MVSLDDRYPQNIDRTNSWQQLDDPLAHALQLGGVRGEIIQLTPGIFRSEITHVAFPHLHVFREHSDRGLMKLSGTRPGSLVFSFPLHVPGPAWLNGHQLLEGVPTVCSGDALPEIVTPEGLDVVFLGFDFFWFAATASRMGFDGLADYAWAQNRLQLSPPVHEDVLRMLSRLFNATCEGQSFQAFEELLATKLIEGIVGASKVEALRPNAMKCLADTARMLCLRNPAAPVPIEQVANILGVSRRHLQNCFRSSFGMTPTQLLRAERLNRARMELLEARGANGLHSVGDIAAASGFWHWSRFSGDYQRMFGELPSQSLRRNSA